MRVLPLSNCLIFFPFPQCINLPLSSIKRLSNSFFFLIGDNQRPSSVMRYMGAPFVSNRRFPCWIHWRCLLPNYHIMFLSTAFPKHVVEWELNQSKRSCFSPEEAVVFHARRKHRAAAVFPSEGCLRLARLNSVRFFSLVFPLSRVVRTFLISVLAACFDLQR